MLFSSFNAWNGLEALFTLVIGLVSSAATIEDVISKTVHGVENPMAFSSRVLTQAECPYPTKKNRSISSRQGNVSNLRLGNSISAQKGSCFATVVLFRKNSDGMVMFRMLQRLQVLVFQVVHRPGDRHGNAYDLSLQCSITIELAEAERLDLFGSCPPVNLLDDGFGRINWFKAEDANEPNSVQFHEDVNSFRLAQKNDPSLRLILQ